jgi:hypothetical protein
MAVSPPPTTTTGWSRKRNPSQVAHDETPLPRKSCSPLTPSHRESAPWSHITEQGIRTSSPPDSNEQEEGSRAHSRHDDSAAKHLALSVLGTIEHCSVERDDKWLCFVGWSGQTDDCVIEHARFKRDGLLTHQVDDTYNTPTQTVTYARTHNHVHAHTRARARTHTPRPVAALPTTPG